MQVKTLFIAPTFFDIDVAIEARLTSLGHMVTRINDRPTENTIVKFLLTKIPLLMPYIFDLFYERKVRSLKNDFTYVLVINGQCLSPRIVRRLKRRLSNATFIYYSWDSIKNRKNTVKIAKFFDRRFCFERDSIAYAWSAFRLCFEFRPLFYTNEENHRALNPQSATGGALFLGTMHSDRYKVLCRLRGLLAENGIPFKGYLFVQSKIVFYVKKFITRELSGGKVEDFMFAPVKKDVANNEFSACEFVVDVEHANQTGLTIRTFEVIKNDKKLITTNTDIVSYDFYDPEFIAVIDRQSPQLSQEFIESRGVNYGPNLKYKYSLDGWIDDVFLFARGS